MGLPFIGFILVIFAFAAVMGGLAFLLIGKKRRGFLTEAPPVDSPAKRLADQWLAESLRRLETVPQAGPSPLNEAAHELLELRLEAVNALNHTSFYTGANYGFANTSGSPDAQFNINSTSFGRITSTFFGPRQVQLGIHYRF